MKVKRFDALNYSSILMLVSLIEAINTFFNLKVLLNQFPKAYTFLDFDI